MGESSISKPISHTETENVKAAIDLRVVYLAWYAAAMPSTPQQLPRPSPTYPAS